MNSQLNKMEPHTTLKIGLGTVVRDRRECRSHTHLQQQIDSCRTGEYQWRDGGLVESVDTQWHREHWSQHPQGLDI
jgi:hypothetical protein